MTTMLITLAVITGVCALLGAFVNAEDGFDDAVLGFFGGAWVGLWISSFIGFWWIVLHFISKFW